MRNLRLFASLTAGASLALAGVLAACSTDDTPAVVTVPDGGGTDSTRPDTGQEDADVPDTKPPFDAGLKPSTFTNDVANALCNALTKCCFGNANVPEGGAVDGGTFDRPECLQVYIDLGFEGSLIGNPELANGNVELDQAKGAECIQKINAMSCNLNGTEFRTIRSTCFAAVKGKVAAGQPCKGSIECAPGNFCMPGPDASAPSSGDPGTVALRIPGTCTALKTSGQNCNLLDGGPSVFVESLLAEYACSYRGNGDTNLRCDSYDFIADDYRPKDQWTCAAQVANDQGCNSSAWCASGICDVEANFKCKSPTQYFSGDTCSSHVNP